MLVGCCVVFYSLDWNKAINRLIEVGLCCILVPLAWIIGFFDSVKRSE